jgi:hypothetical protein
MNGYLYFFSELCWFIQRLTRQGGVQRTQQTTTFKLEFMYNYFLNKIAKKTTNVST